MHWAWYCDKVTFHKYQILPDVGRISAVQAKIKTESENDIFNKAQRIFQKTRCVAYK